jgi:GAF domain-containing protein
MERMGYALEAVLRAVARTTAASLGFGTTVINLHRPAWDDFETVVVEGSEEARRTLLGQTYTRADWEPLLDPRFERHPGAYVIRHGEYDWAAAGLPSYVPPMAASAAADAWHPEDALLVPLRSTAGELLGILSVDEPLDGRRPDHNRLELLVSVAQHAALALEHAQHAAAAERQRAAVDHLLALTARMAEGRTTTELLEVGGRGLERPKGAARPRAARPPS